MKTSKYNRLTFLALLLSVISFTAHAGQLYRFPDENGALTISKVLPPSAAQKGYDILDDKSLRLIKRVAPALSAEEIAELERKLTEQVEAQHRAEIAAKEEKERNRKQAIKDQILRASYHSEQDLLNTRDADLLYRKTQIEKETVKHEQAKQRLHKLQQQAAEQELSGKKVSVNLNKRLLAARKDIDNNQMRIERLQAKIPLITKKYDSDLIRLRQLLSTTESIN